LVVVGALAWTIFGNREPTAAPPSGPPPSLAGRFAIFGSPVATNVGGLYVSTSGGTAPRKVIGRVGLRPSWSPDGLRILMNRPSEAAPALLIVDVTAGRATRLTTANLPEEGAWSPAGGEIVFTTQYGDLYVIRPNGLALRRLTDPHGSCTDAGPSWSPDGSQVTFARHCGKRGAPGLYIIDSNGVGLRRIASNPRILETSWSPDGHTIAFSQLENPPIDNVYLIGLTGPRPRLLVTNADGPAWSPDGRSIAVVRSGKVEFFDTAGHSLGELSTPGLSVRLVAWSRSAA
jgi:Tol biopolymer transport system component